MCGSWLIYPIEYKWTNDETIRTGINMDTVKASKLNPHITWRFSESIQVNNSNVTGMLFKATSKKTMIDKKVVNITELHVINWAPLTPIFLPKNPDNIEANNGIKINTKYIIYILYLYFLLICKMQLKYLVL